MKLSVLIENTAVRGELYAEHGLSLFLETPRHKILFDAGQTDGFLRNAAMMGIDVGSADCAVLSHGHYDHGGGMPYFLEANTTAPLYIRRDAFCDAYSGGGKYIGVEKGLADHPRVVKTADSFIIDSELSLYSCNDRTRRFPSFGRGLTRMIRGELRADDFTHEQYLLIKEGERRILISGCSHKGIENIMEWMKPDALIGGFHFMDIDSGGEELARAAQTLEAYNTEYYTCHCTGAEQYAFLKERLGKKLHYIAGGDVLEI